MVKEKTIPVYRNEFYGTRLEMLDFVIYVDEDLEDKDFSPEMPHKIPRYEMTRVAVASAAIQGQLIHLEPEDKSNGIWDMYHKACLKELSLEIDGERREGVQKILDTLKSG
ncbi:hypothetical protein [Pseudobacteriovorax antillogorgiicola]|uniref:Uncharacterized protein n=1 Tax=Pseudobacteriovorax antillogorgiicola TaxID=1513793 RepID=A0A1Y6CED8_9BACT|nr:hypothetical protein [Pseudobacteriovorax antillogorgiicola]TCS51779.1 hypothetical protein EDD56_110164 [Pseudobacteriovorax antillogorgiicola]SMF49937.1 hypothetical protein SAMN06296036_115133 [Pseudobacteriovorax antillogorgiicola]